MLMSVYVFYYSIQYSIHNIMTLIEINIFLCYSISFKLNIDFPSLCDTIMFYLRQNEFAKVIQRSCYINLGRTHTHTHILSQT